MNQTGIVKNVQIPHRKARKVKECNKKQKEQRHKKKNKMADLSPNLSIITLNVYGLNTPIKT